MSTKDNFERNRSGDPNLTISNPANGTMRRELTRDLQISPLAVGWVVKAGPGTFDAIVEIPGKGDLPCACGSSALPAYPFKLGVCESFLYPEGSCVLVYVLNNNKGYIICSLPAILPIDEHLDQVPERRNMAMDTGLNKLSEQTYIKGDELSADNYRPLDTFAGDITWLNEFMVGSGVLKLMSFMQAGERAKLEFFLLNDMVRLNSGTYQHISSAGIETIYNNYGFNTIEMAGSHHQCEMFGRDTYAPIFTEEDGEADNSSICLKNDPDVPDPYIRARYQSYLGHLGGVFSFFVANPEAPKDRVTKLSDESKDEGLFHTAIDGSGRLLVRSAAGICLQRTDKIAVPKKIKYPWVKVEEHKDTELEEKLPFKWPEAHPYASHLQLRDANALYVKHAYQRFIEADKEYYVPEITELKDLRDQYDEVGEDKYGKEDYSKEANKDASSFLSMESDGSIIIRGKCGEEICLKGGNIIISCPGNVEIRPGKSAITLAGHDAIIKAKKSVDISATDNDVRVKAQKNLHIYSDQGGILLESNATDELQHFETEGKGEDIISSGIVLKAPNSRIFTWGKKIHTAFTELGIIEALHQKATAALNILVPRFFGGIGSGGVILKTANAALQLSNNQAALVGNAAYVSGTASSGVFQGDKYLVPIQKAPVGLNPHEAIMEALNTMYDRTIEMLDTDTIYNTDGRELIKFIFRASDEYGTDKASEVFIPTGMEDKFYMYDASWAFLARANNKFVPVTLGEWLEQEINDSYPWPGKDCYDEDCLVELGAEVNIEQDKLKKYEDITEEAGALTTVSLNRLTIVES